MPNLSKTSGTRALEALQSAQQGFAFGNDIANSRSNRAIAESDSQIRQDANTRQNELQSLSLEELEAAVASRKANTAATIQQTKERQSGEAVRAAGAQAGLDSTLLGNKTKEQSLNEATATEGLRREGLELDNKATGVRIDSVSDSNARQNELQSDRVRAGNAQANQAESRAQSSALDLERQENTQDINLQIDDAKAEQMFAEQAIEAEKTVQELIDLPRTLKTEKYKRRLDEQVAFENMILGLSREEHTEEEIAQASLLAVQNANTTFTGAAIHRPEEALRYAIDSPNFGVDPAEASKVVRNGDTIEIQDANGEVVYDSARDKPASYDFAEIFKQIDDTQSSKDNEKELEAAKVAKAKRDAGQLDADRASGVAVDTNGKALTDSQVSSRNKSLAAAAADQVAIITGTAESDPASFDPEGAALQAAIMEEVAKDPERYREVPEVVVNRAKDRAEGAVAIKRIQSEIPGVEISSDELKSIAKELGLAIGDEATVDKIIELYRMGSEQ